MNCKSNLSNFQSCIRLPDYLLYQIIRITYRIPSEMNIFLSYLVRNMININRSNYMKVSLRNEFTETQNQWIRKSWRRCERGKEGVQIYLNIRTRVHASYIYIRRYYHDIIAPYLCTEMIFDYYGVRSAHLNQNIGT